MQIFKFSPNLAPLDYSFAPMFPFKDYPEEINHYQIIRYQLLLKITCANYYSDLQSGCKTVFRQGGGIPTITRPNLTSPDFTCPDLTSPYFPYIHTIQTFNGRTKAHPDICPTRTHVGALLSIPAYVDTLSEVGE